MNNEIEVLPPMNVSNDEVVEEADIVEVSSETGEETILPAKAPRVKMVVDEDNVATLLSAITQSPEGVMSSELAKITGINAKEVKFLLKNMRKSGVITMTGTKRGARYHKA